MPIQIQIQIQSHKTTLNWSHVFLKVTEEAKVWKDTNFNALKLGSRPTLSLSAPFFVIIKKSNDFFKLSIINSNTEFGILQNSTWCKLCEGLKVSPLLLLHGLRCKLQLSCFIVERRYYDHWFPGRIFMGDNNKACLLWDSSRVSFCSNNLTKYFFFQEDKVIILASFWSCYKVNEHILCLMPNFIFSTM